MGSTKWEFTSRKASTGRKSWKAAAQWGITDDENLIYDSVYLGEEEEYGQVPDAGRSQIL